MSGGETAYWDTFLRTYFYCGDNYGGSAVVAKFSELFLVLFAVVFGDSLCRYSVCEII